MSSTESQQAAEQAVEALEPDTGLLVALDPVSFASALTQATLGVARHPLKISFVQIRYAAGAIGAAYAAAAR